MKSFIFSFKLQVLLSFLEFRDQKMFHQIRITKSQIVINEIRDYR